MQGRSHSMSMSNSGVGSAGGSSNSSAGGGHNPTGGSSALSVTAENRMNLAALQQKDPYITDIVDTAKQVALYLFSAKEIEWERTSIEGTLFVYRRSASPDNGFMILNRLGPNNLIEPITKDLEFQPHDPFLLYRTVKAIYGIWFYDKDECARVGQLMNRLVQLAISNHQTKSQISTRQRRASESDSMDDRGMDVLNDANTAPHGSNAVDPSRPVGIIQLLSKAQHEYNTKTKDVRRKPEPVLITDRPSKHDANSSSLIRPTPLCGSATLRYANGDGLSDGLSHLNLGSGAKGGHEQSQINLETLFQNNIQSKPSKVSNTSPLPNNQRSHPGVDNDTSQLPAILKHLGSTVPMVEDIERQHRGESALSGSQALTNTLLRDSSRNPDLQQKNLLSYFDTSQQTPIPQLSAANMLGPGANFHQTSIGPTLSSDQVLAMSQSPKTGPLNFSQAATDGQRSSLLLNDPFVSNLSSLTRTNTDRNSRSDLKTNLLFGGMDSSGNSANRAPVTSPGPQSLLTPADLENVHSSNVMGVGTSASGVALSTLLSPMAFISQQQRTTSLSRSSNNSLDVAESGADAPAAALTKEQLQQAMIYLLKNDPPFLARIHEAYLLSLNGEISNS